MTFDDELSDRLASRADAVDVVPDLSEVESGAQRRRRRVRGLAATGAIAAVALTVGGVLVVSSDGSDRITSTSSGDVDGPAVTDPAPATLPPVDTVESDGVTTIAPESAPVTTTPVGSDDPAAPFLDRTTEIYRRALPGGSQMIVRRSDIGYAELFGYEWNAPTGSGELCLGEHVVLFGDPAAPRSLHQSNWAVIPIYADDLGPITLRTVKYNENGFVYLLVETNTAATEVGLETAAGEELDRAPVSNGFAVLGARGRDMESADDVLPSLVLVTDGVAGEPTRWDRTWSLGRNELREAECGPGPFPTVPLPRSGEQPADPAAAEAEIRAVHAVLVDRSIPDDERPEGLLDDDTGVAEALAQVRAGTYAESADEAEYTIEELVFVSPTEAWFEYTIDAPTGLFPGRYGIARFTGSAWQITRATICQDLALASGTCEPTTAPVQPQEPADWEKTLREYYDRASLYLVGDGCGPFGC